MESTGAYTSGASAESSSSTPAAESSAVTTETTAGADSPQHQPAADGGENSEATLDNEGEATTSETATAEEDKKNHQKTLEQRAEEIADRKIRERLAEAAAAQQQIKAGQPDFIPVDHNAYDAHIAHLISTERQLQDELTIDPANAVQLVREIRKIQQERNRLETSFLENESKREAWEQRNQQSRQQQEQRASIQHQIDTSLARLALTHNVTPDAVEAGRVFMQGEFQKNPALLERFNQIVTNQTHYHGFSGPAAAVEWAFAHAQENIGKAARTAQQQREGGKANTLGGAGIGSSGSTVTSYSDLMKLPSSEINKFAKEHPQRFENLKEKHFK